MVRQFMCQMQMQIQLVMQIQIVKTALEAYYICCFREHLGCEKLYLLTYRWIIVSTWKILINKHATSWLLLGWFRTRVISRTLGYHNAFVWSFMGLVYTIALLYYSIIFVYHTCIFPLPMFFYTVEQIGEVKYLLLVIHAWSGCDIT